MGVRFVSLLVLLGALIPLSTQQVYTTGGQACFFPFTYKGVTYTACTSAHATTGLYWCGTTAVVPDIPTPGSWGFCDDTASGGDGCAAPLTTEGQTCVYPFVYNGVSYSACTLVGNDKPWCSLDAIYVNRWGNCDLTLCNAPPPVDDRTPPSCPGARTTSGEACAIPFTYRGVTYTACTTTGSVTPWCSLDTIHVAGRWGNCDPNTCPPACNTAKTTSDATCVIPFTYKGNRYTGCTTVDNNNNLWCSLDATYSGNWGYCDISLCSRSCGRVRTTDGQQCALPFVYNGNTYTTCTLVNNGNTPWCSLDMNYNGRYGTCDLATCNAAPPPTSCMAMTTGGDICVFPFTYDGQTYTMCTPVNNGNTPWCALDSVYQSNRWGNCAPSTCVSSTASPGVTATATPPPSTGVCNMVTTGGAACVLPFTYNGQTYTECTAEASATLWCATTNPYSSPNYGNCAITKTVDGRSCVFPFEYRGQTYNTCINDFATYYWCSTANVMVVGSGNWGQCNGCNR